MVFSSYIFLFAFFPITFAVFWLLKKKQHRYVWLTVTGYVFYGYYNWKFSILMLMVTAIGFLAALWIEKNSLNPSKKKLAVIISTVFSLSILGFFKYFNFLADSFADSARVFGFTIPAPSINILLPLGISFYTFQAMSYAIDVYRGRFQATHNFFEYSAYITFFPQLIAGPIVRYAAIMEDLDTIDKKPKNEFFFRGINLFIIGLVKKVVLADSIAPLIDPIIQDPTSITTIGAWFVVFGYTYQLYFDFSGYSDMAIGLGSLFGIKIPQNFNSPFKSHSITEYWRRWHISLSTWLHDYLFLPLVFRFSRNAKMSAPRIYASLIITMFLSGLWHGANWTIVAWGTVHGILLVIDKITKPIYEKIPKLLQRTITFFVVALTMGLFRSPDLATAALLFKNFFVINFKTALPFGSVRLVALLLISTFITQFLPNAFGIKFLPKTRYAIALAVAFVVCIIFINYKQITFIYYQF